ncbi:hypothetical protein QTO34_002281 [Cnephaeus nilssonii]|nr:hypothetical protein QTO34_002281 [Eptesicus nilssonii]
MLESTHALSRTRTFYFFLNSKGPHKTAARGKYHFFAREFTLLKLYKFSGEYIFMCGVAHSQKRNIHLMLRAEFCPWSWGSFTNLCFKCNLRCFINLDVTEITVFYLMNFVKQTAQSMDTWNSLVKAMAEEGIQKYEDIKAAGPSMLLQMCRSNPEDILKLFKKIEPETLQERERKSVLQHQDQRASHKQILGWRAAVFAPLEKSPLLNYRNEESILDLVLRWVNHNQELRKEHLVELLKQVRLELINPSFLRQALKRNTMLLCDANCIDIIQNTFKAFKTPQPHPLNLRYGMETTSLLLCIGNNSSGIKSRRRNYGDASFCYDPASRKTYFISSPKYGEGLGTVCTGVVMENNAVIVAGEASASKLSRQKNKNVEIYRYHDRGNQFWEKLCTAEFRELYALGSVHNDLYVIGGQMKIKNQYLITNCVDKYSVERTVGKGWLPFHFHWHVMLSLNGVLLYWLLYLMQMDLPDEEPDRLSNKLLQYDPSQDQWTERAPMKYSKYRFSTAVVNSEIYVLGGIGCVGRDKGQVRKCLDVVEIYNPDGNFWREGPPMPSAMLSLRTNSTNAGAVDGKLYVCGGFHGADRHEIISKEILELDPWENQWNVVAVNVLMHDNYDVCLVARMNPRDLIPPPSDLVEEGKDH